MWYKISKEVVVDLDEVLNRILSNVDLKNIGLDQQQSQKIGQDIKKLIGNDITKEFELKKNISGKLIAETENPEDFYKKIEKFSTKAMNNFNYYLERAIQAENLSAEFIRGIERRFPS